MTLRFTHRPSAETIHLGPTELPPEPAPRTAGVAAEGRTVTIDTSRLAPTWAQTYDDHLDVMRRYLPSAPRGDDAWAPPR